MINEVFISVVIPTCDRHNLLALCLERLSPKSQTLHESYYEVLVTDDSSFNPAAPILSERYPWVKWVTGPRKGPASNRNNGASHARGSWLVFIDDDCVPSHDLIAVYKREIESKAGILALEGAVAPEREFNPGTEECPVNMAGNYFWSANIAIERNLFKTIKGFDTHFLIAAQEDQDIYIQVKKHTEVPFVKDALVVHPVRPFSLRKALKKISISSLNWLYFVKKNQNELGFHTNFQIIVSGYKSQFNALIQALRHFHVKKIVLALSMLVYGMPVIILNINKYK